MTDYITKQQVISTEYVFDVPSTPIVEACQVIQKVTTTYPNDVEPPIVTTRYQINLTTPFYLSVDCTSDQLQTVIDAIQFVKDHPV